MSVNSTHTSIAFGALAGLVVSAATATGVALASNQAASGQLVNFDQPISTASASTAAPSTEGMVGGDQSPDMATFLTSVLTDIDQFWAGVFVNAGLAENQVSYVFPAPGESVQSACNGGIQTDDSAAFYCPPDDTIVISQAAATQIWQGQMTADPNNTASHESGDFSVALVVAHEYAHALQEELGLTASETRKTELQADCLAGVWANSAYYKGMLEGGDVEEGIAALELVGDYDYADPGHHGTPEERVNAFLNGYNTGQGNACDGYLA
ncbi:exported hypothetical protein [metagenome]|uniref:Metalloprotease n=1 Tax=metagenome TaxID=256318 RepID=A0A2P2C109_9ZZZZ